jgi:hypothetical protein
LGGMVLPGLPADFGKLIEDDTFTRLYPSWVTTDKAQSEQNESA